MGNLKRHFLKCLIILSLIHTCTALQPWGSHLINSALDRACYDDIHQASQGIGQGSDSGREGVGHNGVWGRKMIEMGISLSFVHLVA
jgi:hypothetical protein